MFDSRENKKDTSKAMFDSRENKKDTSKTMFDSRENKKDTPKARPDSRVYKTDASKAKRDSRENKVSSARFTQSLFYEGITQSQAKKRKRIQFPHGRLGRICPPSTFERDNSAKTTMDRDNGAGVFTLDELAKLNNTRAEVSDGAGVSYHGTVDLLDLGGGGGDSDSDPESLREMVALSPEKDSGRVRDWYRKKQQRRREVDASFYKPTFNSNAQRWTNPSGAFISDDEAMERLADWQLSLRDSSQPARSIPKEIPKEKDEGTAYLGNAPPDLRMFVPPADKCPLVERVRLVGAWALEVKAFVESGFSHGEAAWQIMHSSIVDWHRNWVRLGSDTLVQGTFSLENLASAREAGCTSFCWWFRRAYGRVASKIPTERRSDLESEMELLDLDPFQRFCAILTDLRRSYDVRSPEEKVSLMRRLEHPVDWVRKDSCVSARGIHAWIRACRHAESIHNLAWDRVILGVHDLHRYVLGLTDDKVAEARLARYFSDSGVEAYCETPDNIFEFCRALAVHCSQAKLKAPGRSAFSAEKGKDGKGKGKGLGKGKAKPVCFICGKSAAEHEGGRFCDSCRICKKKKADHASGTWCPNRT